MLKIIKKGSRNFTHYNGFKEMEFSKWQIVFDHTSQDVVLIQENGASFPKVAEPIASITLVVDDIEETFVTTELLRERLVEVEYNPLIDGGAGGGIPEAPLDGNIYGRKDAGWEEITGGGGSQDLQETLDNGSTATFTGVANPDLTAEVFFPLNSLDGFQFGKSIITPGLSVSEIHTEDRFIQNIQKDVEISPTDIRYIRLDNITIVDSENLDDGDYISTGVQIAKTNSDGVTPIESTYNVKHPIPKEDTDVIIEMPYKEASGTYRVATQDEIPDVDATPTDGSSNAVSSNGVFDALELKAKKSSILIQASDYTLANQTTLQKMFNVGSSGNGSFTCEANKTYVAKIVANISGLSSTSGTISIGSLGTASLSSVRFTNLSAKATSLGGVKTTQMSSTTSSTGLVLVTASTGTTATAIIEIVFRTTSSGSFIPALSTSVGTASAIVETNSYCRIDELGTDTLTATSDIV